MERTESEFKTRRLRVLKYCGGGLSLLLTSLYASFEEGLRQDAVITLVMFAFVGAALLGYGLYLRTQRVVVRGDTLSYFSAGKRRWSLALSQLDSITRVDDNGDKYLKLATAEGKIHELHYRRFRDGDELKSIIVEPKPGGEAPSGGAAWGCGDFLWEYVPGGHRGGGFLLGPADFEHAEFKFRWRRQGIVALVVTLMFWSAGIFLWREGSWLASLFCAALPSWAIGDAIYKRDLRIVFRSWAIFCVRSGRTVWKLRIDEIEEIKLTRINGVEDQTILELRSGRSRSIRARDYEDAVKLGVMLREAKRAFAEAHGRALPLSQHREENQPLPF